MKNWREYMTLSVRVTTFALAVGILGAFWFPWISVDGMDNASRGIDLLAMLASPQAKYLTAASPISAGFLLVCPIGVMALGIWVSSRYVRRRAAIPATAALLALAAGLPYGASGLLEHGDPVFRTGLAWIVATAAVLLVQQVLIKVSTRLRTRQKFPSLYRTLAVFTGSGFYRWRESRGN